MAVPHAIRPVGMPRTHSWWFYHTPNTLREKDVAALSRARSASVYMRHVYRRRATINKLILFSLRLTTLYFAPTTPLCMRKLGRSCMQV